MSESYPYSYHRHVNSANPHLGSAAYYSSFSIGLKSLVVKKNITFPSPYCKGDEY